MSRFRPTYILASVTVILIFWFTHTYLLTSSPGSTTHSHSHTSPPHHLKQPSLQHEPPAQPAQPAPHITEDLILSPAPLTPSTPSPPPTPNASNHTSRFAIHALPLEHRIELHRPDQMEEHYFWLRKMLTIPTISNSPERGDERPVEINRWKRANYQVLSENRYSVTLYVEESKQIRGQPETKVVKIVNRRDRDIKPMDFRDETELMAWFKTIPPYLKKESDDQKR